MSVDFSQFFNGPIRDSLIAQVSGYLDIPRPQATTAYDKAVALVIGAMALQAGKPEGAQQLAAHVRDSQTQGNLTSSALSPTVLTNDQFAQIVTVGEREQGAILGAQLEPVVGHLEVATGLDRTAVGSLLSVIVPFVLSYLKNNITTEASAADKLPALLAAQAPHVAPQLDAPALAALGGKRLEDVFGPDVNGSADAHSAPAAAQDRGSSSSANANERTKGGWFKWVLTLAVILAGVAWVKSCTQSDTALTENTEPATQDQSAAPVPAPETTPAETAPTETTPTEAAPVNEGDASAGDAADSQGGADAPAAHFPEPVPAPTSDTSPAPVENSTPAASTDSATSSSATQTSAVPEQPSADTAVDQSAANTNEAASAAATAAGAVASETDSDQTTGDQSDSSKNATDSVPEASDSGHTEDSTTTEPTSGPASDSMETEPAPTGESDAGADATTPEAQSNQSAVQSVDTESAGKTTTFADSTASAATTAATDAADSSAVAPTESSGKTTTFAVPAEPEVSGRTEQVAPQSPSTPADQQEQQATPSDASANTSTPEVGVPGKTTTFGEATQSPGSTDTDAPAAETRSPADTTAASDQPAQVLLQREGDALIVSGIVSSESDHTRIVNALKLVDGHSRIQDDIKIDPQATAMTFDDYSGLLSLLRGYHDVNLNLENDALTLTGKVASQEEKDTLTSRAQSLVGSSIQVHNQAEVVAPAQAKEDVAVSKQVLFASGSAEVEDRFHDALDRLAQQLNENGKRVRLVGFADESGSTPLNEVLSKRRAESVKAYLILRGVPADRIQTEGKGVQAPVADNTTQEGRAQNRRVEFYEE